MWPFSKKWKAQETVIFATRLAQRLAGLGDGVAMDTCAYRFFGPEAGRSKSPNPDFDAREHVQIQDARWKAASQRGRLSFHYYRLGVDLLNVSPKG